MAATTGYLDIGAIQRIESGDETPKTGYLDIGAVQRSEPVLVVPNGFINPIIPHTRPRPFAPGLAR